ncbi:MAG: protein phosphatase CheZ [Ignavibacteriales bacterium]|nr:protein phosphatase CheZ [Ignavibacteriales bacterium]
MMSSENMSQLFAKLNDLKKVFTYGEKLIPVIQSLGEFMKETVPLLENINKSIAESTSKIPKASNQIQNVTSATEMATTEILDLVDVLNADLESIEKCVVDCLEKEKDKEDFLNSLIPKLNVSDAKIFVDDFLAKNRSTLNLNSVKDRIKKMKDDTNSITLSLQVQDITSQQLATVNHLIESVQDRLASLIDDFDNTKLNENENNLNLPEGASFDPNARYSKSVVPQQEVDSIFNKEMQTASQAEIDKLFN